KAVADLAELAAGPLAGEVERALRPLRRETLRPLKAKVLRPLRRRATREGFLGEPEAGGTGRRWTWPTVAELAAALIAAAVVWEAAPRLGRLFTDEAPVHQKVAYRLTVADPDHRGSVSINIHSLTSSTAPVVLIGDEGFASPLRSMDPKQEVPYSRWHSVVLDENKRGRWYYVRARLDRKTLAVSQAVWVERAKPAITSRRTPDRSLAPPRTLTRDLATSRPPVAAPKEPMSTITTIRKPPKAAETTVERQGSIVEVKWDCGEVRAAEPDYELQPYEEFVAARLEIPEVEGAQDQKLETPVYDAKLRRVRGRVTFLGPGRRSAANAQRAVCPGFARVRLAVTVRIKIELH
ncbi:MAG: hypothetical protein WAM82_35680, partial [Thermoanaerobaculia bacterium]